MAGFERGQFSELSNLHRDLREKFNYITDQEKHGLLEKWEDSSTLKNIGRTGITKFTGDCEEFALVSMDKARAKGLNVRLVVCRVETGEGHAICEVASTDYTEAYYFDNRQHKVCMLSELKGYTFVAVSPWNPQPGDERPWYKVEKK